MAKLLSTPFNYMGNDRSNLLRLLMLFPAIASALTGLSPNSARALPQTPRRVTTAGPLKGSAELKAWKKLLDPSTDEFWREGSHVPDAGFLLWAKNPTKENARNYLIRMNKKRDRLHLMQEQQQAAARELIRDGLIADDYDLVSKSRASAVESREKLLGAHIFFFFAPTCKHSLRQAKLLEGLDMVSPLQVGGKSLKHFKGLALSTVAKTDELKVYVKEGVLPVIALLDEKSRQVTSLKGVHTLAQIHRALMLLRERKDVSS